MKLKHFIKHLKPYSTHSTHSTINKSYFNYSTYSTINKSYSTINNNINKNINNNINKNNNNLECFIEKSIDIQGILLFIILQGLAILRLNRPIAKNSLGLNFMSQFKSALESLKYDPDVRVLLIASNVDKVFCAGADLKERATMTPIQVSAFVNDLQSSFYALENLPMPTISVLDGVALGGGLELALSTDIRILIL